MALKSTISSTTSLTSTGSTSTNLNGVLFVTANAAMKTRVTEYSAWSEVSSDSYISTSSNAYQALKLAFSQPDCGVPILLGRRSIDSATITPEDATDNKTYGFTVEVYDTSTNETVDTYAVSVDSGDTSTVASIATLLYTELATTQAAENIIVVDNTGSLTITAESGYDFLLSSFTKVEDTYVATEEAATVLSEILEESLNDWYFMTCEDHSDDFVTAMAEAVELTKNDDYPKLYRFSSSDTDALVALASPATDILGKCYDAEYTRTAADWHHNADTLFPEVAAVAYQSGRDIANTWKYLTDMYGVSAAQNPVTGKELSTTKLGYLVDRNVSFQSTERGVTFQHGGSNFAEGYWTDILRSMDWINSEIETRLLNLLLNATKSLTFTTADQQKLLTCVEGVLKDAIDEGILSGYDNLSLPDTVSTSDQIDRILDSITYTGYLSGAIHFVIIDGTLTYTDEEL